MLRDVSHVRDYSAAEWTAALHRGGFAVRVVRTWQLRMDFPVWTERMRTPDESIRSIRRLQNVASADVRRHFAIEADGSFLLDVAMFQATAA